MAVNESGIDTITLQEYIEVFAGWPQIISVSMLLAIMIASVMIIWRHRREHAKVQQAQAKNRECH